MIWAKENPDRNMIVLSKLHCAWLGSIVALEICNAHLVDAIVRVDWSKCWCIGLNAFTQEKKRSWTIYTCIKPVR